MSAVQAFTVDPADTVAVTLADAAVGARLSVRIGDAIRVVGLRDAIPLAHKVAVVAMPRGAVVIKYGTVIATATRDIAVGEHVHVHNAVSNRARRSA